MKRSIKSALTAMAQAALAFGIALGINYILQACSSPSTKVLHVLTTGDVHASWFGTPYQGSSTRLSLENVSWYADSVRTSDGASNVLLLDAGDCLQGDNAAYYYNYVDTLSPHIFPRLAKYMKYDAVVVGNHDIETGHSVYDRVASQLSALKIPFLAGNAVKPDGSSYFPEYKVFKRAGMKVLVLGYTNANMKSWLSEDYWKGMDFVSLVPFVQERVDAVKAKEKPDVTVVVIHSGTGEGDGSILESQGMDLFNSLSGVDLLVSSHDHRPFVCSRDGMGLINGGSHARKMGHAVITADYERGKLSSKKVEVSLIGVDTSKVDTRMREKFSPDFAKVSEFVSVPAGELEMDIRTSDAYGGMSDYVNLLHTVQLESSGAKVSFAAPLTYNKVIPKGKLTFNDMFTLYPYENTLCVMELTGKQIKDYLEFSYSGWTAPEGGRILNIRNAVDPRTGQQGWSFVGRSYNFDSAAGIIYEVYPLQPEGKRIKIKSFADGSAFSEDEKYRVAMTSYRASGGGGLLVKGAGIEASALPSLIVGRYPEIRNLLYEYVKKKGCISKAATGENTLLGEWSFQPESVQKEISKELELMFR